MVTIVALDSNCKFTCSVVVKDNMLEEVLRLFDNVGDTVFKLNYPITVNVLEKTDLRGAIWK